MNDAPSPFETSTHNNPARPGAWGKKAKVPPLPRGAVPPLEIAAPSFETEGRLPQPAQGMGGVRPAETPFAAGALGAVMTTQKVGEVRELRASILSHVLPVVVALIYGYYHYIRYFWHALSARNGRPPSLWSLVFLGALGCYGIYSVGKTFYSRWAASRSLLRADSQGITLHNEKRRTFVSWDQIDHYSEAPPPAGQAALFRLCDAADNVVLEWPQAWPATFAPAKPAADFHAYLRARVPNRRLQMAELPGVGTQHAADELRAGETIKISYSSLGERRAATIALSILPLIVLSMIASPVGGALLLMVWLCFLLWHIILPCSIIMDAQGITLKRGTRRRSMVWNDVARRAEVKGRFFGNLVLYGRADQRLVLPVFSLWYGAERMRAHRLLLTRTSYRALARASSASSHPLL